jgi:O-antigen/teichoic acid export membrane protein
MQPTLNESLVKITRGVGIAFIGYLSGLLFTFLGRLLIARYGTESDYGEFSLVLAVLSICVVIALLGLPEGASRSIAYARSKNEAGKVQDIISSSLWFALIASLTVGLFLFLTSGAIARIIFHDPALGFPLKIFAIAIPFSTLINISVSLFRGFDDVRPTAYFHNILRNGLFLLLLGMVIFFRLPFSGVFYTYLASLVITCIFLFTYTIKRLPSPIRITTRTIVNPVAKELLFFSLPLLGVAALQQIIIWFDTLMLGYFRTSAEVGLYNIAHPLAVFISAPVGVLTLIYLPVISGLYAEGQMPEIRRNFRILVKWLNFASLPLFFILFIFPETVLSFLFGAGYVSAAGALKILSLGFIIDSVIGLSETTLIALGQSRFIMWATLATVVINIGLNIALIPPLGIEGAAIALAAAIIFLNLIRCWKLYSISKAQPLSRNLIKPVLVSLGLVFLIQFIAEKFLIITWWMLPVLLVLYYGAYFLAVLFTRSFDEEDIALLLTVEKRTGINARFVKRLLRRFV